MKKNQRFDFEERKIIEFYIATGISSKSISNKLGRLYCSILLEIGRNGGRVNYSAKKAQERAENLKLKCCEAGRENLKRAAKERKGKLPRTTINSRLSNLEFQVEIILETIKELKEKLC